MIEGVSIFSAFIAGVLTFFAPCTFPLIPGYLGIISGQSIADLSDSDKSRILRKKITFNGLVFSLGFSFVFIVFGLIAGIAGIAFADYRVWLTRIGGVVVMIFGLFLMGTLKIGFLEQTKKLQLPSFLEVGKPSSSFLVGAAFAFGWSPCVGPILAGILLLATTQGTILAAGFLMATFSLGLAIPFLITAFAAGSVLTKMKGISKYLKIISIIGGIFLVLLGILLLTDNFVKLFEWGFKLFGFLEYEKILDYL